ncbi:putative HTH-type transcriptional regulator YybA [Lentilactobacillus fungorum]|uniref:HTH-type transcriptional regulator YybA n=1 Tax=Lentilactobacillus fungorum TaxID=2201250 RepID=A0ABQ3W208_9LACO|nr:putative HTH-type transcriptional regulator YybA [Lentilactobacillus fungorum]
MGVRIIAEILRPIGDIARALDSIANIEFKELTLAKGQYLYLVRICEHPGIIQERLAEMIKVDRTTASRAIRKLAANGLIERRADEVNKKIKRLFPTEEGKQRYPLIQRENRYSNQIALTGLTTAEADTLAALLLKVRNNVAGDWEYVKKGNRRHY